MNINKIDSSTNFNGYLLVSGRTIKPSGDTIPADSVYIPTSHITEISVNKNNSKITDIKWENEHECYATRAFADIHTILAAYNAAKDNPLKVDLVV